MDFDDIQPVETEEKPVKQRAQRVQLVTLEDGRTGWEYSDGSIRNDSGHMMVPLPGGNEITRDNARELLARRHVAGLRAQLRGMARSAGLDPSDMDEKLLEQAATAFEAQTLHFAQKFKESNSLRDMSAAYGQLSNIMLGDKKENAGETAVDDVRGLLRDFGDLFKLVRESGGK